MSEKYGTEPIHLDGGETRGDIVLASPEEVSAFLDRTVPAILRENDALHAENVELLQQVKDLKAKIPKKQKPIALNPNAVAFVRRGNERKIPGKIGELWDEDHVKRLDAKVHFDLSFPRGRYVTGFVGTMTLSYGSLTTIKDSLLWHDFYIDIKDEHFWRGKIIVQRRTEDDLYNVRSLGVNEYVGR